MNFYGISLQNGLTQGLSLLLFALGVKSDDTLWRWRGHLRGDQLFLLTRNTMIQCA